jgi:protein O-GlcNAc transferase
VQYQSGRYDEAVKNIRRAIARKGDKAEFHANLSLPLRDSGKAAEALEAADRAIALREDYAEAHSNRGLALLRLGRAEEAIEAFQRAIALRPNLPGFHNNLGNAYRTLKKYEEAVPAYEEAIRLRPRHAHAMFGLGVSYDELNRREEAMVTLANAILLNDNFGEAHRRLGMILSNVGIPSDALDHLNKALELDPKDHRAYIGAMFIRNYLPQFSAEEMLALAKGLNELLDTTTDAEPPVFAMPRDPEKPLTVGFISGDLGHHPVATFTRSTISLIDRSRFKLVAYATRVRELESMEPLFDRWHPVNKMDGREFLATIRADAPDILVDLAGFTANSGVQLFVRRLAPVQVTWLGYSGTTGVREMDYILADRWIIPEHEEHLYSEKVWRMPDSYLCWTPPAYDVEVGPPPCVANGYVTFGCFNNIRKISETTVATWAGILSALPTSKLLLKAVMAEPVAIRRMMSMFHEAGVPRERIEIQPIVKEKEEHFTHYNRVDIALDPFPYCGTTTTAEALWMGVPVLTLAGNRFISRVGETFNQTLGTLEWIAANREDYVARAVALASDIERLAADRATRRQRFMASPLVDAPRFARNLEAAFRDMWRKWCAEQA